MTRDRLRRLLAVAQHSTGLLNAYLMIDSLAEGKLLFPAVSAVVILMVANWKLPSDREEGK